MQQPDRVDRFVWERALRDSGLPFGTRGVLAILGSFMNADGTGARPSLPTLAAACGLSRRTVSHHLEPALTAGWLARESGGSGKASRYSARLPIGQQVARAIHDPGNSPRESGQPVARDQASGCPPPRQDQDKTKKGGRTRRCQRHADDPHPPPCLACKDARVAADAAAAVDKQARLASRECPHGRLDGMTIKGAGPNASRLCGDCDVEQPAVAS